MNLLEKVDEANQRINALKEKLILCGKRVDAEYVYKTKAGIKDEYIDFLLAFYGLQEKFPLLRYFSRPGKSIACRYHDYAMNLKDDD